MTNAALNTKLTLADAPEYFNDQQKAIWAEVARLTPPNSLSKRAALWMELISWLIHKLRSAGLDRGERAVLGHLLAEMPLAAVDAQKLMVRERTVDTDAFITLDAMRTEGVLPC